MTYDAILTLHILIGCTTLALAGYAGHVLWKEKAGEYAWCAFVLGTLAAIEILTGTVLAILSIELSAVAVCSRVAIYLSCVAVMQVLLYVRMKNVLISFPLLPTLSPVAASLMLLVGAVSYGF